jgi:putative polyketide hydroxylase
VAPYLGTEGMQPIVDDMSMEIGYRYNSAAMAPDPAAPAALTEHPRDSRGRPGSRAPHVALEHAGKAVSTLDLFGRAFVILAGRDGTAWRDAALEAADGLGVPVEGHVVGDGDLRDPAGVFADAYGIASAGAVLVRPDGFVAWRAHDGAAEPAAVIGDALAGAVYRTRDASRASSAAPSA